MSRSAFALYDDPPPAGWPSIDIDPFSVAFFSDPRAAHEQLREAGPVVWLSQYGLAASGRYQEVRQALLDWQTFSSARGVGMADFKRHGRFRLPSIVLEADPPLHNRSRATMNKALSPQVVRRLKDQFRMCAVALVDRLVEKREFDGCCDLAEAFPLRVFPDAIGMRSENRHHLLPYGDMLFNSFGPANALFQASSARATEAFEWVNAEALRENLSPEGFGMILYRCADAGEISHQEAHMLVRAVLAAGVDTTVNGFGAVLFNFARFPQQWEKLRANPELARASFEEAIRLESPVQTFFRTTTRAAELGGMHIDADRKILLFLGAANCDPRRWGNPHTFDIERRVGGHVAFGAGIHMCVGQSLARLEGEVLLRTLAERVLTIEIAGTPERRFNNTLRGFKRLPLRITPA